MIYSIIVINIKKVITIMKIKNILLSVILVSTTILNPIHVKGDTIEYPEISSKYFSSIGMYDLSLIVRIILIFIILIFAMVHIKETVVK